MIFRVDAANDRIQDIYLLVGVILTSGNREKPDAGGRIPRKRRTSPHLTRANFACIVLTSIINSRLTLSKLAESIPPYIIILLMQYQRTPVKRNAFNCNSYNEIAAIARKKARAEGDILSSAGTVRVQPIPGMSHRSMKKYVNSNLHLVI
jgi:hypothetical protein